MRGDSTRTKGPRSRRCSSLWLVLAMIAPAGLACGSTVPERVTTAGVEAYSPVPSDALPVRVADADALARLTEAVRGLRYARADDEFTLAPAAFSGLLPHEPTVVTREVVRVGDLRIFWSAATTVPEATFREEQLAELRAAERLSVEVRVELPGVELHPQPETRAEAFVGEMREAFHRGIREGLEKLYEGRTVPAHGRVFALEVWPELVEDEEALPRDPTPLGLRRGEYRYRLGKGLASPHPEHLNVRMHLWVLPDVPLH